MTGAPVAAAPVATPENVFAQAFLQATNAILITDADIAGGGPFIVHANPAFCRMSGYRLEELVGRSPRILQGPRTDRKMLDALREHLEQGLPFSASTVNYAADDAPTRWNGRSRRSARRMAWSGISYRCRTTSPRASPASRSGGCCCRP